MSELRAIDIDLDVHKLIEAERRSFSEAPNTALRRLLGLPSAEDQGNRSEAPGRGRSWSSEGVELPDGTALRMEYNGRRHEGKITDGKWLVDGRVFESPSGAASGVAVTRRGTRTRLDGWIYWEVLLPGDKAWLPILELRRARPAPTR